MGNKAFTGKHIKEVVLEANEQMISLDPKNNSEDNLYIPKTRALFAKVSSMEETPQELLDFAQKYDLPIFLIGE